MEVRIKLAANGVIVCAFDGGDEPVKEYVYKDVKHAVKEIEGIISVLKEEEPKTTESDLEEEEEKINKGGK